MRTIFKKTFLSAATRSSSSFTLLRKVFLGWGRYFARVLNLLVLFLIYVLGFGVSKLLFVLVKMIGRRSNENTDSYWLPRAPLDMSEQGMEEQF